MSLARKIDELSDDELLEVRIDDYGFTGEGYVRLEDGWLSIRGALPGERVSVRVEPQGKFPSRRRWATLVEVLTPSPARIPPHCDQDATCKGCQLRHASIQEEARYKERAITEVLERYAHIPRDEQPAIELIAPQPWSRGDAHRIRTSLTYRSEEPSSYELGLNASASLPLTSMSECAALIRPVRRLIDQICEVLDDLADANALPPSQKRDDGAPLETIRVAAPTHGRGFVELVVGEGGVEDILELDRLLERRLPEHISRFLLLPEGPLHLGGPERRRLPLTDLVLEVTPSDWFHATLTPASVLYERVIDMLDPRPEMDILDIGCGIGTLALLSAARGARTLGIDQNTTSIQTAEHNAINNGLEALATFQAGSWESGLRKLAMNGQRFERATINPMREPLGERALSYLEILGVERVVYLGPSPASTARDIDIMRSLGWEVVSLGGAMLHPATYHVMLVAQLEYRGPVSPEEE